MSLLLVVVMGRLLKGAKVLGIRQGVALKSWFQLSACSFMVSKWCPPLN